MNIGHKTHQSRALLGVKQHLPLYSIGPKIHISNGIKNNTMSADSSMGLHNNSNSNAVARVPMLGAGYNPPKARQPNIEKHKRESVRSSKFA
jgi:hypothetical protein